MKKYLPCGQVYHIHCEYGRWEKSRQVGGRKEKPMDDTKAPEGAGITLTEKDLAVSTDARAIARMSHSINH